MRTAPKPTEIFRYPVVSGVSLAAVGVTLAWWAKVDMSPLMETAMIRRGELWRLVTSMFPHVDSLHLIFNVYWLWVFGTLVEEVFGHLKTAGLILLFAAGSGAFEFAFADGGVGLSGVGYGLFGMLWILSLTDPRFHDAVDRRTIELFVIWFVICVITTVTKVMPVANIAHGAGALLGVLTGAAIARPNRRVPAVAGLLTTLSFGLWASTFGRPHVNFSSSSGYEEARWGYEALGEDKNQEAARWLRDAAVYQPRDGVTWYNLAIAYRRLKDEPAALAACRKGAELGDADAAYQLGGLYARGDYGLTKDSGQALSWYRKSAQQGNTDALNDAAWIYATSEDASLRNPALALEFAQKAVSLEHGNPEPDHLDTLAEAYYVNAQYEDAVKAEERAIALSSGKEKEEFQVNLGEYRKALHDQKRKTRAQ
jgi:membrane associated rhomboid family serine protease